MIELEPVVTVVLGVLLIPPALWFYVEKGALFFWWLGHRGFPTDADLATAPTMRWHTLVPPVRQSSSVFEVRVECTISTADTQSVDAPVRSSETNDSVRTVSFNEKGMHLIGQFTFRVEVTNTTIAQVTRRVTWGIVYFDTHGRFGYVTNCWADVSFDGNDFLLGRSFLDLSGPRERHEKYRRLPEDERRKYEAMFRGEG